MDVIVSPLHPNTGTMYRGASFSNLKRSQGRFTPFCCYTVTRQYLQKKTTTKKIDNSFCLILRMKSIKRPYITSLKLYEFC